MTDNNDNLANCDANSGTCDKKTTSESTYDGAYISQMACSGNDLTVANVKTLPGIDTKAKLLNQLEILKNDLMLFSNQVIKQIQSLPDYSFTEVNCDWNIVLNGEIFQKNATFALSDGLSNLALLNKVNELVNIDDLTHYVENLA